MLERSRRAISEMSKLFVGWTKGFLQVLYGVWKLSKVPRPRVTFFGGANLKLNDPYAHDARKLAQMCVEHDISIVTGGGPGIMEAGNCGVLDSSKAKKEQRTIGISIADLPEEEEVNACAINYNIVLKYFFGRKWLLIQYSEAFVVFPGGFGTVDEMAEVLTLIKTKKIKKVPVILYDSKYWASFLNWVDDACKSNLISSQDRDLITVLDSIEKIFDTLKEKCTEARI